MRFDIIRTTFTFLSITGTGRHTYFPFLRSFLTVVTCKDYECSYGYEYRSDYHSITCKDGCDDDQCCDKGGCAFPQWCTIPTYASFTG